jgi:hypothetical protein
LVGHEFIIDEKFSGIIGVHGRKDIKQRRFATTRSTHDRYEIPALNGKRNILQYILFDRVIKRLIDGFGLQNDLGFHLTSLE